MADMNLEMTLDETLGVEAVKYMNATVGHTEPQWVTLKNWRTFNDEERKFTMDIYHRYKELEKHNDRRLDNLLRDDRISVYDSRDISGGESPSGDLENNLDAGETRGSNPPDNHPTADSIVDSDVAVG